MAESVYLCSRTQNSNAICYYLNYKQVKWA